MVINRKPISVLFVASGTKGKVSSIVANQLESLKSQGLEVDIFLVNSRGVKGYIEAVFRLLYNITEHKPDIIHAHYSLCGYIASIASLGRHSVVCSLMGSDVYGSRFQRSMVRFFSRFIWSKTIVKSNKMKSDLGLNDIQVVPNGVNLTKFKPMSRIKCREQLNWNPESKVILFAANPDRQVKNFTLAEKAVEQLRATEKVDLVCLVNVPNDQIPIWMNASDVVLLTSLWEGSPNVIKESMACNRPIVSTDVGDVRERLANVENAFVCEFEVEKISKSLKTALSKDTSNGREAIASLDEGEIAKRILRMYAEVNA